VTLVVVVAGSALVALAVLAVVVLVRARDLRARHVRAFGARVPVPPEDKEHLVDAPRALYHGTRFAGGAAVLSPDWHEPCVGDLFCTEDAVFLRREGGGRLLFIPLRDIEEAELHRAHAELAGKDLPMLRLLWTRGGERLLTSFSLPGGMASLERLRREIHLRQPNVVEKLAPLLAAKPPAP
jgi:hypothetical protein